jgi:hypothetical protein
VAGSRSSFLTLRVTQHHSPEEQIHHRRENIKSSMLLANRRTRRKTYPSANLSTTKRTLIDFNPNPFKMADVKMIEVDAKLASIKVEPLHVVC